MNRNFSRLQTAGLLIAIAVVSIFFGTTSVFAERIDSYYSRLQVQEDGNLKVTETIRYNPEGQPHHGILRNIPLKNAQGGSIQISDVSVVNERGVAYQFSQSGFGEVDLKIGDPENTFTTPNTYVISYNVSNAYSYFKDFDEIYWNTTGNDWPFPILNTSAEVDLPNSANSTQYSCYNGIKGSTDSCKSSAVLSNDGSNLTFFTSRSLSSGEGLTVAVGFPKGVVPPESSSAKTNNLIMSYLWILTLLIVPVPVFFILLKKWRNKWRAPKGTGVIIAQYDTPQGLTPIELDGILNESVSSKAISAEIIYLATKGYLKIVESERNILFYTTKDYELQKIKELDAACTPTDLLIARCLFTAGNVTLLSSLKKSFYVFIPSIKKAVLGALVEKGFFRENPTKAKAFQLFLGFALVFLTIFGAAFVGAILSVVIGITATVALFIGMAIAGVISFVFGFITSVKTADGVATKEWILGFKEYLQIAEKDRINFANAPEKKPETFEKFLPFAIVLGVEKAWAKEFEGIYITPPNWYSGPSGTGFSAIAFTNSLSSFNSMASTSLSSSPGGSGGGGSSGGGGGGGGGGSW